jgi:hypothetical protein
LSVRRRGRTTVAAASIGLALSLALTGCRGNAQKPVSGLVADFSYDSRSHTECSDSGGGSLSRKKRSGSGSSRKRSGSSSRRGRSVLTTGLRAENCRTVSHPLRCVELDDVNGKPTADGRWYEVKEKDYERAAAAAPGKKLRFTPKDDDCGGTSNGGSSRTSSSTSSSTSDDSHETSERSKKSTKSTKGTKSRTSKSSGRSGTSKSRR